MGGADNQAESKGAILVVDDNPSNLSVLSKMLMEDGYAVHAAINGSLALESLRVALPDMIVLDVKMPELNGYEICRQLKADDRIRDIPVIFISGTGEVIDKVEAFNAGGVDYITKPFHMEEVLARVAMHISLKNVQKCQEERNQALRKEVAERKKMENKLRESQERLRFLSSRLLTIQEEERQRTAREIHDSVSQSLAAVKLCLENALVSIAREDIQAATRTLENVVTEFQNIIRETKRIYMELRPSTLDDFGVLATIRMFCREFQDIYPQHQLRKHIKIEEDDIPQELKIVIFRIIEEALSNVARHSSAKSVVLSLAMIQNAIQLMIEDGGTGFDLRSTLSAVEQERGFGLSSMRERTEVTGGSFSIRSIPGKGTTIRASWPGRSQEQMRAGNEGNL
jgi:two-component system, sensor histidine kinase and response regulator